jgi:uncharacterized protein DUF5681
MADRTRERKPSVKADASGYEDTRKEDYKVGPGRPPKEYQWKKGGRSPNPKGRPRNDQSFAHNLKRMIEDGLKKKVVVTRGERVEKMTRLELGVEHLLNQYAKGERWARRDLMEYAVRLGINLGQNEAIAQALTPDYQAIVDDFLRRNRDSERAAGPREMAPPELRDDDAAEQAAAPASAAPQSKPAITAPGSDPPAPHHAPAGGQQVPATSPKAPNTDVKTETESEWYDFCLKVNKPRDRK